MLGLTACVLEQMCENNPTPLGFAAGKQKGCDKTVFSEHS